MLEAGSKVYKSAKNIKNADFYFEYIIFSEPRIFSKIRGDIRSSRFATGVNDTGGKWKKPSRRKILIILFGHLWVVEKTYI
jgi:hypothetical protein